MQFERGGGSNGSGKWTGVIQNSPSLWEGEAYKPGVFTLVGGGAVFINMFPTA